MKVRTIFLAASATILAAFSAFSETTVSVTDVIARQRYPWNGLVDITCKVSGIGSGTSSIKLAVAAVDQTTGNVRDVSHIQVEKNGAWSDDLEVSANGTYHLLWDAAADLGPVHFESMVVRVTCKGRIIQDNGHTGVQLWEGGPYWATTNIGAEAPEDYGLYFWWGDTVGHRPSGTTFNFSISEENCPTWNKSIATLQSEGWITADNVLAPNHDAAHVQWGGEWRMPTSQELYCLCNNSLCNWTWTSQNGINGCVVRGWGDYANASIFLPAAGDGYLYSYEETLLGNDGSNGYNWSSSVTFLDSYENCSCLLLFCFNSDEAYRSPGNGVRCNLIPVRPVQGGAEAGATTGADSAPLLLDTMPSPRIVAAGETIPIAYSPRWNGAASCTVAADGMPLLSGATHEGTIVWTALGVGTHTLTHTAGGETLTVTFTVSGYRVLLHGGGVATSDGLYSVDFDMSFGETRQLPANPFKYFSKYASDVLPKVDVSGRLLGWRPGTSVFDWDKDKENDLYSPRGNVYATESYVDEWKRLGFMDGNDTLHLYAVWKSDVEVTVPSAALAGLVGYKFDNGDWRQGDHAFPNVKPGTHRIQVRLNSTFGAYRASVLRNGAELPKDDRGDSYVLELPNDGPYDVKLQVQLDTDAEVGSVIFNCSGEGLTDAQRKAWGNKFPPFDASKVGIAIYPDGISGVKFQAGDWEPVDLPAGSYRAQIEYGEKANGSHSYWRTDSHYEIATVYFNVGADSVQTIPLSFQPFGSALANYYWIEFQGNGGKLSGDTRLWFGHWDEGSGGSLSGYSFPNPVHPDGLTFDGWRTEDGAPVTDWQGLEQNMRLNPKNTEIEAQWKGSGSATIGGTVWNYAVSSAGATLGEGSSPVIPATTAGAIAVPSTLGGQPVTSIGDGAFAGCSGLTSVTIPDSVTSIGSEAFSGCASLQTVTLAGNIAEIGGGAFRDCQNLATIFVPVGWDGASMLSAAGIPSNCYIVFYTPQTDALPVHRFYSKAYKGHFFTISESERQNLIDTNPNWRYEGTAYKAYTNEAAGTTALYRFYSKGYRGHFFTIDADEAEGVKTNPNWKYEGVAYYVYPVEVEGAVPVFRFWSKGYRHHFYTTDEAEKDNLIATNPNWKYEGIAFYALPADDTGNGANGAGRAAATAVAAGAAGAEVAEGTRTTGGAVKTGKSGSAGKAGLSASPALSGNADDMVCEVAAPWTLTLRRPCTGRVLAVPDVADLGEVTVETSDGMATCLAILAATATADAGDADDAELRLTLPDGVFTAQLWDGAGTLLEESEAESSFDFSLAASDVWHSLVILDANGEEMFSIWLRAEGSTH